MKEDEKGNQEGGVPPENNGNNGKKKKRSRNKKGRDGSSPAPSSSSHASTSTADPSLRNNQMKPLKPSPIKETTPGQSSSQAPQPIRIVSRDPIESQRQVFENQRKNSSGKKEESPARGNNQQRYNANQNNRLSGYANNKFYPKPRKTQETFLKDGSNWNVGSKEALAVKNQRSAYYFSENAGQAPSVEDFSKTIQYEISAFPLKYNEPILISEKYDLMISSTSSKCDAWYVRVKSQNCHDTTQTVSAMLHRTSSDAQIRTACLECIENFDALQGGNGRKNERCPTSEASEEYLRSCFINKLSGPPEAFPEATYYCLRCDYHINSVSHAKQHLETSSHFDDVQRQQQRIDLFNNIPAPCQSQSRALKKMLMAERDEYLKKLKFTEENVSLVIRFLKNTLFESLGYSNVELQVYGSYTYDACLPDSDLNVAFSISTVETSQLYQLLGKIVEELRKVNIHAELVTELPNSAIVFEYENVPVRLCWLSNTVCFPQICLSKLLKTYVSLRPEIVQFIQLIRWWATRVGIDSKNKQKIGLPRYGFDLMAIHYLQQKNMIPVLHELFLEEDEEGNDPNASFHSEDSVKMILEEAREKRIRTFSKYLTDLEKINERFDLKKEWNWGCLWIDFFKYHAKKHRDGVIQITQKKPMSKDSTRWNRKLLHVVDPFRGDNVLSIPKVSSWLPYFFNSLLSTYLSFAIPRTSNGPIASVELYQKKVVSPSRKNQSRRGVTTEKKEVKKVQPEVEKSMFDVVNCTASELTAAQEEALEEREIEFHSEQIASRLEFDGIKLNKLKAEDVEIDEHHNRMYSRRTVVRVHRKYGYSKELKQEIDGNLKKFTLAKFKSPKKKTKNAQLDLEVAEKVEVESIENNGVERNDAEVFHVNCVMATPIERSPTPPTSTMWSYWQADSLAEAHCEYPACPPRGLKILKKEAKSDEVREKREEKTAKEDQPSTSTKPNCEFGEFPGSGTFVGNSTDYSRTTEDLICYEEFFIRGSLNGKELKRQTEGLCSEDFLYAFDPKLMTGGYEMETRCSSCDGHHLVDKCPSMEIPPVEVFTKKLSQDALDEIDEVIAAYYKKHSIASQRLELLEKEVENLQMYLRDKYRPDVVLTIFGSVMTGIGVRGSDIDICLRFDHSDEPPADIDAVQVILEVADRLRRAKMAKRVQSITTAKVPIVKFLLKLEHDAAVDADISYYNILALYNTKLLKQYTTWTPDNRFAKLGLFVKHWAKHCDIGDASKGSISSYAHIILLISYLQQCDPPVLPRLQESFRDENSEKRLIENWDTYFYEAIENGEAQKKWAKNKQSCAELLIGFFDFYTFFNYKNFVIQCRREAQLAKMEKEWNKPLCIEDPFDLHHNLGSGVTKKMFAFIHRTIVCSREVFMKGDVRNKVNPKSNNFNELYRTALLNACSQGHAPTDRQCHICQKIGHFAEGCPKRLGGKPDNQKRQRFLSTSTNMSYRGRGGGTNEGDGYNKKVEPTHLEYYKRQYNRK